MIGAAATPPCTINVPAITEQADGSGVQTGHVKGSCTFAWHSRNEIWYKDRWQILGSNKHAGGVAGAIVTQPVDREDYGEYGLYQERVVVYEGNAVRVVIRGPISYVR